MVTTKIITWARVGFLLQISALIVIMCHTIPTVSSAPAMKNSIDDLPSMNQSTFMCGKPQPRAYNLEDLLIYHKHSLKDEGLYQPSYIVVHRCDGHAGCCNVTTKICKVAKNSIYHEELEVIINNPQNTSKNTRRTISIEHHRKCRCTGATYNQREDMEQNRPIIKFI